MRRSFFVLFIDTSSSLRLLTLRRDHSWAKHNENLYRVSHNNCAPFVWLLWRSCRFNDIDFTQFHRSGFNLELETLFESI